MLLVNHTMGLQVVSNPYMLMACVERHASFCKAPSTAADLQLDTRHPSSTANSRKSSAFKQTANIRRQASSNPVACSSDDTVIEMSTISRSENETGSIGSAERNLPQLRTIVCQKSRLMTTFTDMSAEEQSEDSIGVWPLPGSLREASRQAALASSPAAHLTRLGTHMLSPAPSGLHRLASQDASVHYESIANPLYDQSGGVTRTSSHPITPTGPSFLRMRTASSLQSALSGKPARMQSLAAGAQAQAAGMMQWPTAILQTASSAIDDTTDIPMKLVDVEVHSLGKFAFKGLSSHRQIAQLMPMSLSERLALFPHVLKRGKATCVTANNKLLASATAVLPDVSGLVLAR